MLINLSTDREVLECLATDDRFVESLMARITVSHLLILHIRTHRSTCRVLTMCPHHQNPTEPNANELSMLFANLGHHDSLTRLLTQLIKPQPNIGLPSPLVIDQLVDLFVRADKHNPAANYDYLSYVFADLAKHAGGRKYFTTRQKYDGVIPLTKMTVFTEHKSPIRRRGVASTIKNVAFELDAHPSFLSTEDEEVNILPFILLPLTGSETYSDEEMLDMLPDLQLLPPDKEREPDVEILKAHVETLMILSSSRDGREKLREAGTYYVVRETHLRVEDEGVREVCDRLVQVLMRDEEGESGETNGEEGALVKAGDVNGVGRVV
jgi:hypothetical protein